MIVGFLGQRTGMDTDTYCQTGYTLKPTTIWLHNWRLHRLTIMSTSTFSVDHTHQLLSLAAAVTASLTDRVPFSPPNQATHLIPTPPVLARSPCDRQFPTFYTHSNSSREGASLLLSAQKRTLMMGRVRWLTQGYLASKVWTGVSFNLKERR